MSVKYHAVSLTALLLVSACTVNDQNVTRAQGAGAGAALGAGLGAIIGGDAEDALIGAAVGGLAGLAVGEVVARKKANYASGEEMISREREILTTKADEMVVYNAGLERELDKLNRDITALEAEVIQGQSERAAKIELRRRAAADLGQARQRLVEVNQEIDVSRGVYEEAKAESEAIKLAEWDRRIRELERRRNKLVSLIDDYEASVRRMA